MNTHFSCPNRHARRAQKAKKSRFGFREANGAKCSPQLMNKIVSEAHCFSHGKRAKATQTLTLFDQHAIYTTEKS
jgi:hypothetical protein